MSEKNPAAVELAKARARKLSPERRQEIASSGGSARLTKMTAKERSEVAKKAAAARWAKKKDAA